jgi:integrase/recombinase XerD
MMRAQKRLPSYLNSYEQFALLKQPNPKAPTGLRNLCLLSLMLKLGLRVSEVINLKYEDIDWENGKIHISESGAARERTLWIDKAELDLLKKWHRLKPESSTYFFSTLDGSKLKDRYIREMVKRLARKAGVDKDVYPHLLRYTFAVDFMRENKDIHLLQEALGHRDLTATQAYTRSSFDENKDPYITNILVRRSGTPVPEEKQISFSFVNRTSPDPAVREHSAKSNISLNTKHSQHPETDERFNININVEAEKDEMEKIRIPAIKCSRCNYILHYQGNCPKCGTSFAEILRHWGRII